MTLSERLQRFLGITQVREDIATLRKEQKMAFEAEIARIQALASLVTDTVIPGIDAIKASVGDPTALDAAIADLETKVQAAVTDVTPPQG